jgi:hypothetical protein
MNERAMIKTTLSVLLLACASQLQAGDGVRATLVVSSGQVLPLQAVRLQLAVLNAGPSKETLSNLGATVTSRLWVKGPKDPKPQRIRHPIQKLVGGHNEWNVAPLSLGQNENASVSFQIGADWFTDNGRQEVRPIFKAPGQYEVTVDVLAYDKDKVVASASTKVDVMTPNAEEGKVLSMIASDAQLSEDLLSTTTRPSFSRVDTLVEIDRDFSHSSYAPYAQYALARSRLRGNGLPLRRQLPLAEQHESYMRLLKSNLPDSKIRAAISQFRFDGVIYPEESQLVDSLLTRRDKGTISDDSVGEFLDKCAVERKVLSEALRLCEVAGSVESAHSPAIAVTEVHIQSLLDRRREATLIQWLNANAKYRDSIEWLKQRAATQPVEDVREDFEF